MSDYDLPAAIATLRRVREDPNRLGRRGHGDAGPALGAGHGATGPASKRVIVGYGFWIFLLSDIVMFSCFFAAFAVQREATAGGPTISDIVDLRRVALETAALLLSSYSCGLSFAATNARNRLWTQVFLAITAALGLAFVLLEAQEFYDLVRNGVTPQRSGMLTAFFGLVGLHGVHVSIGGLWLATMMAQVQFKGFRTEIVHRLICFNLFWHALDIVWIGIFTIVYLIGAGS
ncbi:cytochrome o ubiquinol oxidase subunit 3 [Rhodoblastus acidophilus]|uniref:cytochrome (ubi)quinol oxidase subunit III n=1 Tax=Rhodoblastus acidophilus TaxID=1074 RepID=UPI00160D1CE6|nr:cytochrome (ubi)quinol oxidase subunit III [Rhodoblastus acidophilus]MCW2283910.1 cytochrome o ubiquinol oxidase subunit 3 [Rhodoblastus acidophilus]MCW2332606.1 cytochrome o ubiquinol oxidase subunit 3 [Rhodoblastus acidophilus]